MKKHYEMLGSVDLLGLDAYGDNPGMSPLWGAAIGGVAAGGTSFTLGKVSSGSAATNRDIIGFGVGVGVSGLMWAIKRTRHASFGALIGAFLAGGLPFLERVLFGTVQMPAATAAAANQVVAAATGTSGMGIPQIRQLGIPQIRQLGISTASQVPSSVATAPGVAGLQIGNGRPPVNLMNGGGMGAAQVALMGGPNVHGIAGRFGSTHFAR